MNKREDVKDYKSACKIIGRKPRKYTDEHMMQYEELSTIVAALNFISNNNVPYKPDYTKTPYSKTWYVYIYISTDEPAGLFGLRSDAGVGYSGVSVGSSLRFKNKEDGEYCIKNFKNLWLKHFFGYEHEANK